MLAYYTLMIRLVVSLSLVSIFAIQAAPASTPWSRVAALYHQRLEQTGIVGSSLMVVKNGDVAHQAFEGYQDRATRRAVDAEIYHWASITKTFTGIAIMQLRDRGLLSLDDPVVEVFVPELREVHNP